MLFPEIIAGFPGKEFISFVIRPENFNAPSVYDGLNLKVSQGSASNIVAGWKLFWFAKQEKKAVFHVFSIGPFFLFILRLAGVRKLIYSIHGTIYWNNGRQKFFRKIFWWLAINRKEYRFTSNSEFSKGVFLDKIDLKANIEVLYNPISLKKFNSSGREISESDIIKKIIYAGRLDSGKGLLKWIKYAVAIHKINQGIKFEIYGEGQLNPLLQETILKSGAEDFVILKGYIKDIWEAYRSADLLLFVSEFESFGNVVVESILCGTPVLTSDIPSMKEILLNYPGFLVPAGVDQEQVILDKLKDYQGLKKLCGEAAEEFKYRFSSEQHIRLLGQIYKQYQI